MGLFTRFNKKPDPGEVAVVAPAQSAPAVAPIEARETPAESPPKERGPYFPNELADAEQELIKARRDQIKQPADTPPIGVGLSGGGIRSATFCFGVFTALARVLDKGKPTLLTRIDYVSTVSGGGYFGSFLGALFRRDWVNSADDVAAVLRDELGPEGGQRPARFLRDNGRYLAPRGSGDLLVMLAAMLRNWISVQCVMIAFVLAAFVLLQVVLLYLPTAVAWMHSGLDTLANWLPGPLASWARPIVDGAKTLVDMNAPTFGGLWWSGWFLVLVPIAVLWSVPTVWGYWVIDQPLATKTAFRRSDLLVILGVAGGALLGWIPQPMPRFIAFLGLAALATTLWTLWGHPWLLRQLFGWIFRKDAPTAMADVSAARRRMSSAFKTSVVVCAAIVALGLIDTLGSTLYVILNTTGFRGVITTIGATVATFAGVAAYGRQLLVLFGGNAQDKRPRVSMSIVSWIVAVVIVGAWLVTINVGAHAIAWQFQKPSGYPASVTEVKAPKLTDADQIVIQGEGSERTIKPFVEQVAAPKPSQQQAFFALKVFGVLAALIALLGQNTFFINLSTLHTFYSQRLTRAYLGATNRARLCDKKTHITDVIDGDDIQADRYWRWPLSLKRGVGEKFIAFAKQVGTGIMALPKMLWRGLVRLFTGERAEPPPRPADAPRPFPCGRNGSPLHIVNVTINETFDNRTGIQVQDRKGVPLAIGPAGLSVGIRHHLVADKEQGHISLPGGSGYCVFDTDKLVRDPEELSLGRWVSISGAAAGSAVGSRTTLPTAMLATFANVRLGYWWDSGLKIRGGGWLQRVLPPVYRALLAEFLCNLRGTGDRLWNLSDGGHFENLGGYELIRRRLPLIILVDAEQDADYKFSGLADLVRKARLDFGAEIEFMDPPPPFPGVGTLADLRRVTQANAESKTSGTGLELAPKREALSRAHAAIAKVTYADGKTPPSCLVYVKATLTGDEPVDVLEYHSSHPDFPHDSTANQFFDEAQWESYRRLGEHIGSQVLTPAIFDLVNQGPGVADVAAQAAAQFKL